MTDAQLTAYLVVHVHDGRVRTGSYHRSLAKAQTRCERELQSDAPLVDGVRFDWVPVPADGPRRWQLDMYAPGVRYPDITDYMVREVRVED
jgi:hypothetical protein